MNQLKKEQAITLIALVVTLIILIILASVRLNMVLGDSGIITEAKKAANKTVEMELNTQIAMNELQQEIEEKIKRPLPDGMDETDVFVETMGDKEITQEDIDDFNKTLEEGKKIIGIRTIEDLKKIGVDENYPLNGLYVVLNDISLQGENWNAISTESNPFIGIFNGANKTLDGLTITQAQMNTGLFGFNKGKIKNIELTNVSISSEHTMVGGITGQNSGIITNCTIESGSIIGNGNDLIKDVNVEEAGNGGSRVGGICGQITSGKLENSYNTAKITTDGNPVESSIGGCVGTLSTDALLQNSYNIGDVKQYNNNAGIGVGGIVGDISQVSATLLNCYYLYGTCVQGFGLNLGTADSEENIVKSSEYMKSSEFLDLLNQNNSGMWKVVSGKNNGYPVLYWE